ncbi:MAG: hypothetical protein J7485_14345 [Sphingobium sp.]|nr:hypothetical protein [Sphingobium sp.]
MVIVVIAAIVHIHDMIAALTIIMIAGAFAWLLAFKTTRGGWLGVPLGLMAIVTLWFGWTGMPGSMELPSLGIGAAIAALAAVRLPKWDAGIAAVCGSALCCILFLLPSGGADNPLSFMLLAPAVGFAVGGALSLVWQFATKGREAA